MDGKPPAEVVVGTVTEKIEQLRIHQSNNKIKCRVGVADDNEQCCFLVAERVKLHFIM